jgi:Transposase zinc-ribbon domain
MEPKRFAVVFDTEEEYSAHLERLRWPDGIICIYCTYARVARTFAKTRAGRKSSRGGTILGLVPHRRIFQCGDWRCRRQFSVTSGTIFHKTHVPLSKWYRAIDVIEAGRVTAQALQNELDVSYQTAWYLRKRIQDALRSGEDFVPGFLPGFLEDDED